MSKGVFKQHIDRLVRHIVLVQFQYSIETTTASDSRKDVASTCLPRLENSSGSGVDRALRSDVQESMAS